MQSPPQDLPCPCRPLYASLPSQRSFTSPDLSDQKHCQVVVLLKRQIPEVHPTEILSHQVWGGPGRLEAAPGDVMISLTWELLIQFTLPQPPPGASTSLPRG